MAVRSRLSQAVASLALAAVVWLLVHDMDRLSATFHVPITYDQPASVVKLGGYPVEADVRVLAPKPKLRTLTDKDFAVIVANREGHLGPDTVVLDRSEVSAPFGVIVQQVEPAQFTVTYDRAVTRSVPVIADVAGSPAEGFEVREGAVVVDPPAVDVTGPASLFTQGLTVKTEPLDVSGRTTPLTAAKVHVLPPRDGFSLPDSTRVSALVRIEPKMARAAFDEVPVLVAPGKYVVAPPSPHGVRVSVEGPEAQLRTLHAASVTVVVDAAALLPAEADQALDASATVDPATCPGCRIVSITPRRIHVRVHDQHHRSRRETWEVPAAGTAPPAAPEHPAPGTDAAAHGARASR